MIPEWESLELIMRVFDPGFGLSELKAGKTKAVLEIRSHDVPF